MAKQRKKKKKKPHHPPTLTKRRLLAEAILMEADDLLAEDKWDEAQLLLEEAIEDYPYNAEMLSLLGACYLNNQELHRAVRTLERCIALSGAPREAYYNLVPAYAGVGALIAAHWMLQQSLQRGLRIDRKMRQLADTLEAEAKRVVDDFAAQFGLDRETAERALVAHDRGRIAVEGGERQRRASLPQ